MGTAFYSAALASSRLSIPPFEPLVKLFHLNGESGHTPFRCDAMLLVGVEGFAVDDDIDLIGRDRRNYIRSRFQKYLPCAIVDCARISTPTRVRAAQNRGIEWLDWNAGLPGRLRVWLQQSSERAADSYGVGTKRDEGA
jgi:hypothetical protein